MNIAICDDEMTWQKKLIDLLDQYSLEKHIEIKKKCFSSGSALSETDEVFDIIFMDYQMEGLNGIETAGKIRLKNSESVIIFVSSYPQIAPDTFEVKAFRFLKKPIISEKLFRALDDYIAEIDTDSFLAFKMKDGTLRIRISDIIYVEAARNHTIIHTAKNNHEVLINLKEIEKKLPREKFYRSHKAFLVSFFHIETHTKTDIRFDDGSSAFLSRKYLSDFNTAFQEYILKYNSGDIL